MKMDTVLFWNIRGLRSNLTDLKLLLSQSNAAVAALQDCKWAEGLSPPQGFIPVLGNCDPGGEAALLIRNDIRFTPVVLNSNLCAAAATVTLKNTFTICSIYLSPSIQVSKRDLENLVLQLPKPFLLVGDFNAHSPLWGDSRLDGRGEMVEKILEEQNLIILNDEQITYFSSTYHTPSSIDLAVASPSLSSDFQLEVNDDLCGSDHYPIFLKSLDCSSTDRPKTFNFKKADWNLFGDLCSSSIDERICSVEQFTEGLMEAARATIPYHSSKFQKTRVPWFTADVKNIIKNRKKAQRKYRNRPSLETFIEYKKLKAKSKLIIKQAKMASWQDYVSKINFRTSTKAVWKKIRKIKGKDTSPKHHLKKDNHIVTDKREHAGCLAEAFAKNSSKANYSAKFQKHQKQKEKEKIKFHSDNSESYNRPFTLLELQDSLKKSNESAAGPDGISYQLLTHLPESCLKILLNLFNGIWTTGEFPPSWREATVVPIPKPNRDLSNPSNYRPIALTSCLCKTMERMVNSRLVYILETKGLIAETQCGFRKDHSTSDHLVRFETFVRSALSRKNQVLAIFFDLEKAYDTTWRFGILKDLFDLDFRGSLPIFIENFLCDRRFRVRSDSTLSDVFSQETGVPQGSILSPVLFNLKINNIVSAVSPGTQTSLFVDDFAIYMEGKNLRSLQRRMQLQVNCIQKWVSENGFKVSATKTNCVHFHRTNSHTEPLIDLDGHPIPVKSEARFLGVIFDSRMTFRSHIKKLKFDCSKALNILRVVGHSDWGADRETLLKLYRSLVRSKLDYGCVVYGSASQHLLKSLDPIHHQGLRIALGAFRTSPVQSLYSEAGEPSLEDRRSKLALNYFIKIKSLPHNPCFSSLDPPGRFNEKNLPLGPRVQKHLEKSGIDCSAIDTRRVHPPAPWEKHRIHFDVSLSGLGKDVTNPLEYKQEFLKIKTQHLNSVHIYTDGSKQGLKVGAAAYVSGREELSRSSRLVDGGSVFSAELEGIIMALEIHLLNFGRRQLVIFTDSLSAIEAIKNRNFRNKNVCKFFRVFRLFRDRVSLSLVWVPAHVGIHGNEGADRMAKEALGLPQNLDGTIFWRDLKTLVNIYIEILDRERWSKEIFNKLHEVMPSLDERGSLRRSFMRRRIDTVITRLKIGHTYITHKHLLRKEEAPQCVACAAPYTVKHILIECSDFAETRNNYYQSTTIGKLFKEVDPSSIVGFLQEIGIYSKI